MLKQSDFIIPNWPVPNNVHALQTNRYGGCSHAPYDSFNLGDHVKDNPIHVAQNRQLLSQFLPTEPVWLNQVHGIEVINAADASCLPSADASFTNRKNTVCVTMTADCLPILLCDNLGTIVASVHAGWRSLCNGVIEATVKRMITSTASETRNNESRNSETINSETSQLMAWLGPAIGPNAFEVGAEVRDQSISKDKKSESAFKPLDDKNLNDKWLCDIYQIATQRLNNLGVTQIYGGGTGNEPWCTFTDENRFFSFRRDGDTGRMATLIWMQ